MKHICILLFVLLSSNLLAQNSFNLVQQNLFNPALQTPKANTHKKRGADERLIRRYNFNTNSGSLSLNQTDTFSYSNYRKLNQYFDYAYNYNIDYIGSDLQYSNIVATPNNFEIKYLSSFNSNEQITSRVELRYNATTSTYDSSIKEEYIYDPNSQLDSVYTSQYLSGTWYYTNLSTYDFVGTNVSELRNYDYVSGMWLNSNKQSYTYNASNNVSKLQLYSGLGNMWNNILYADYTYNTNNKLDSLISYIYNTTTNAWDNLTYVDYSYISDTNIVILIHNWDSAVNYFKPIGYSKVLLNSGLKPDTIESGNYTTMFIPLDRILYKYTALSNVSSSASQNFNTTWQPTNDSTSYIYELFNSNVAIGNNPKNNNLNAYPNPIQNKLFVEYEANTTQQIKITVSDALGNIIYEKNKTGFTGNDLLQIDTKNWNNGFYLISIFDGNNKVGSKKLVKGGL